MKSAPFTSVPLTSRPADQRVWQVITEQASAGQATIYEDNGSYLVQFPDEEEPISFDQLAYSNFLGLYDKRRFPDLKEEEL